MKKAKKLIALLLALVMVFGLAACGGDTTESQEPTDGPASETPGGDLVSINITNYYQGQLRFEAGLPATTHSGPQDFHGYGMKSMRTIARKYGGEIKVKAEDGIFVLTVWLVNGGARPDQSSNHTN